MTATRYTCLNCGLQRDATAGGERPAGWYSVVPPDGANRGAVIFLCTHHCLRQLFESELEQGGFELKPFEVE